MPGSSRGIGEPLAPPALDAGPCDVCGGRTIELHCKIICRDCCYTRDCLDP